MEVIAHVEPSRYECKQAHVNGAHVNWQAGYETLLGNVNDAILDERLGLQE